MADKKTDQFYTRPPKLSSWESFKIFLWNSETNQFLGRTGTSWGKIILFYLIFYAVLIGFFAAMLAVFYQTLKEDKPKYLLSSSLIGDNPGLGFRPMPPLTNVESTLVWYSSKNLGNVQYWENELNDFLAIYDKKNNPYADNIEECRYGDKPNPGRVCNVAMDERWSPCLKSMKYNYNSNTSGPCIFLKLNKIYGWIPEYYNASSAPEEMPKYIKDHMAKLANTNKEHELKTVWVSCEGENNADIENIGSINYFPTLGFQGQYFPFENVKGYLSPIVAVYFEKPKRGVLINIECKAWAANIHHDRADRRGSVHFELLID